MNFFLTPRQLHALIYLSNIFLQERPDNDKVKAAKQRDELHQQQQQQQHLDSVSDIDRHSDYRSNEYSGMSGGLGFNQGWSSDPTADMYSTAYAFSHEPIDPPLREFEEESSNSSSMTGSACSSASQSTQTTTRARRRGIIDADPNADILRINIRVACCAIVLLQEDILVESSLDDSPLGEDSVKKLKQIADTYFDAVGDIGVDIGAKEMHQTGLLLDKGCSNNHLRYGILVGLKRANTY